MSWNYRVVKRVFENEKQFAIHEVYYNDDGEITMFSSAPIFICGDSLKTLSKDLKLYIKAFKKPVLSYKKLCKRFNIKE